MICQIALNLKVILFSVARSCRSCSVPKFYKRMAFEAHLYIHSYGKKCSQNFLFKRVFYYLCTNYFVWLGKIQYKQFKLRAKQEIITNSFVFIKILSNTFDCVFFRW